MMTLWCMFRSPLMVGAELTKLDEWTLSLLTDRELLGLAAEGRRGRQLLRSEELAVWINEPENETVEGGTYIAVFNLKDTKERICLELPERKGWSFDGELPAHGVRLIKG